jgi:hypothetical protein
MSWDKIFKLSSKFYLKQFVQCDVDVGVMKKYIDTIMDTTDPLIESFEIPKIFKILKGIHILEFKSERDQLLNTTFPKLMGYTGFYMNENNFGIDSLGNSIYTWLVLSGNHPQYHKLKKHINLEKIKDGIYSSQSLKGFYVLLTDELHITEENKLFLINASIDKFKQFLSAIVEKKIEINENEKRFIKERFYINYGELRDMTEVKELMNLLALNNLKEAIKDAGLRDVLYSLGKDEVINTFGKDEVINTIGEDEILESMDLEKIKKFLEKKQKEA